MVKSNGNFLLECGQWSYIEKIAFFVCFLLFCSDPALMPVLFPTIIAAAFSNDRNKEVQCLKHPRCANEGNVLCDAHDLSNAGSHVRESTNAGTGD